MKHSLAHIAIILTLMVCSIPVYIGCTGQCFDNQSSIGLAGFYSSTTQRPINVGKFEVYGVGAPNDSAILKTVGAVSQFYMPLPIEGNECSYVIHYTDDELSDIRLNDTLTLHYDAIPYFAGSECGAMYIYKIKSFTHTFHLIDSVTIPTMEITNADVETIKLYMRTS